jgi:hypothetical protein
MKNKEEFISEEKAENKPAGGVFVGKKDGQTIIHDEGTMSGYLVGKLHKDGGIKAVNKATGQPLEMQGGEIVITAPAVSDTTKREFEGKMMTNREILSKINSDGGGVSFADGGDIPAKINTTDCEYKFGGKLVKDTDIAHSLGMNSTLKKGKQQFSSGDTTYDIDAIYNAIKKGKLRLKTKEVETFPMKYPVYDKNYAENHKIDFRKPNGITVLTESGEEVLIDGNHRMNNAYSNGRKTMKTYYIEDPKQISKFSKKNKFELGGENKMGGHLSKGKSLKQIAEMHNVSLAHINEELAKGLEVEKEHFADFKERTRVAKDHLVENPKYYTILEKAGLKNGGSFGNGGSMSKENEFAFNNKSNRLKSFYKTNNPSIDKLLIEAQPFIAELIEKQKELVLKETLEIRGVAMPMSELDVEYYEIGLLYKMVQSFNKYLKVTDVLSDATIKKQLGLFEISATVTRDGKNYNFYTELIPAGGYNIQEFHYRYITKTDLPQSGENSAVENLKSKNTTLNKIKSIDLEIENNYKNVKRYKNNISNGFTTYKIQGVEKKRILDEKDIIREGNNLKTLEKEIEKLKTKRDDLESVFESLEKKGVGVNFGKEVKESIGRKLLDRLRASKYKETGDSLEFKIETRFIKSEKINTFAFTDEGNGLCSIKAGLELRGKYTSYAEYNNVPLSDIRIKINEIFIGEFEKYLKDGGHIQRQELVEKSKKGDTPARDLNNYNDIMDLEADGMVGADSGLAFANGGEVNNEPKEGDLITNFGKYGASIIKVDDDFVYWLDQYASKQYCKKSELSLNNLDDDGDDDGYYEDERNSWVCNKKYANGGITPYDANLDGDSVSIAEEEFSNGGGVELPIVSYVKVSSSGSSLINLIGNKYNSYIEFAESVEYAYKQLGTKPRSYVQLQAFDENGIALIYVSTYISDQKNTIKNFNPLTGNYKNLEKSLANSRPRSFQKFNWEDWLLSKVTPSVQTTTSTNKSASTSIQSQYPEYYEFIGDGSMSFSKGKIYKIINPKDINDEGNFIDNSGTPNGFSPKNKEKFKPSTEEAFLAQQGLVPKSKDNSVDVVRLEYSLSPSNSYDTSFRTGEQLHKQFHIIMDYVDRSSLNHISVNIIAEVTDKTGKITAKKERIDIGENFFNPNKFSYDETKKIIQEKWFNNQLDFDKFFKLEPKKSTKEKVMFLKASSENTEIYVENVTELRYFIERQFALNDAKSGRVYLYLNGDESQGSWRITFGDNQTCTTCYDMLTDSSKRLKEILLNYAGADEFDWSDFFEEEQTNTPISVVPKTVEDSVYSLDLAIKKLEKASSTVVTEYNKEIYDKSLKFLYDTKATYELALKFTPESAFMYERLDILKKLADIEKKIKNIEDMKKGGAFYMLAKILEKLERGENWRQSESAEDVITNHIPKSEIEIIIRSQKFKNWFGDWEKALVNDEYDNVSKALTDGIPSVYHHGARRIKYTYREVSNGVLYLAENISYAMWFSQNATAQSEEGNYLTECFVNVKNPIDLTAFHVNKVDLGDIVRYVNAVYPMAKIYDFIPAQVALLIKTNQPTNVRMWAWQLIRSYAKFVNHIKENTPYDGFLYYENNPSDEVTNPVTGQLEENITKAVAIFKSHQVKVVDAVLFDGGLDDWRFENGGKIKN